MIQHSIDWFLERLEGVEGSDGQFMAWCPCHPDIGTSLKGLSITVKGNRILMTCHSCGAHLPEVLAELEGNGYTEDAPKIKITRTRASNSKDTGTNGMQWWVQKTGVPEAVWKKLGCTERGSGVQFDFGEGIVKVRKPPKAITWEGTDDAEAPPLWPHPMDECPKTITLVVGESDCGTAHAAKLPYAFALTKGDKGALPPGWAQALKARGVEAVEICGDTDRGGQEFTARASREATAVGLTCRIIRLEKVLDPFSGIKDLNGVWRAAESQKHFKELIERATEPVAVRITFKSVKEMEEIAKEEVQWLIPDLIAPGDKIMLAAPQKSLKSWSALELTRALSTASPFLRRVEWKPAKPCRIGFVEEEGSTSLWARRIQMLGISGNSFASFSHRTGFRFTEPSYVDEIISSAGDLNLDMLILDPLQKMMPGLDSNSDTEVGIVWDEVFRIQQTLPNLVIMLVHHTNKQSSGDWESIRGSSRHAGEVDLGIFIERHPTEDNTLKMKLNGRDIPQYLGTGEYFEVKYKIDRDEMIFEMDATEIQVSTPKAVGGKNKEQVLQAVRDGANTRTKIMHETEMADNTVLKHLAALIEEGLVEDVDNGPGQAKNYIPKEAT